MWETQDPSQMSAIPVHLVKAKYRAANCKNFTSNRGDIRTMTPKKVKGIVLKHFGNKNLTIQE
jgi:hypothetical protein